MIGLADTWLWRALATGFVVAVPCALVGVFLYLRRMSLVADALAHVALPGIVIAFLITGGVELPALLAGAVLLGMGSTFAMQAFTARGVREDASIGIVFTTLFAVGVILLSTRARGVDLDLNCVLFGDILGVSNSSLITMSAVAVAVVGLVLAFYRWLQVATFDPTVAATLGVPVLLVHNAVVATAAVTAVTTFEAVGAVLGVALVIVPAATAHRLADRLSTMLAIAVAVGLVSVILGTAASVALNASTAGAIVVAEGILYAAVILFGPRFGTVTTRRARARGTDAEHLDRELPEGGLPSSA